MKTSSFLPLLSLALQTPGLPVRINPNPLTPLLPRWAHTKPAPAPAPVSAAGAKATRAAEPIEYFGCYSCDEDDVGIDSKANGKRSASALPSTESGGDFNSRSEPLTRIYPSVEPGKDKQETDGKVDNVRYFGDVYSGDGGFKRNAHAGTEVAPKKEEKKRDAEAAAKVDDVRYFGNVYSGGGYEN